MFRIVPVASLSAAQIAELRKISGASIAQIREAAASGASIRDVKPFGREWRSERVVLAKLAGRYANDPAVPFTIRETKPSGIDEPLDPQRFADRLAFLRGIEVETQMQVDLENGSIAAPGEFEVHDKDWT